MPAMAAQAPVLLGTAEHFAVLAGTTITNTGSTTISGEFGADVGLHPGTAITQDGPITLLDGGVFYQAGQAGEAVALAAKNDLIIAYNDAASRRPDATMIDTQLGGQILIPGVYYSDSGDFNITGTLTLDAEGDPDGVFIFLTNDSTLITATSSVVELINGARFCRVFWQVGSSATLGTYSNFVGHIFALTSISAKTGAIIQGQLLAQNGAVTLEANRITNGFCPTTTPTPGSTATPTPTPGSTATPTPAVNIIVPLGARKTLVNRTLKNGEFTFLLKDAAGNTVNSRSNDAAGNVVFDSRQFSAPGLYLYTIAEVKGDAEGITYDPSVFTVRINVTASGGLLSAQVSYLKDGIPYGGALTFQNTNKLPGTGDSQPATIAALLALAGLVLVLALRRKRDGGDAGSRG